ncbi:MULTISPECIES: STY4534 family ICE replication protein [unclassified Gilliamella]|uniref:STY4534 family ICE replication protein n=1 Tax=unclassified Gilliamella TaxID=2685620 RepID=UPI00080E8289|nr:STY4534 family ICE replication protein [Gilliamella apicola]OCG17582.1 hypothetical protein A9G24_02900 [Gilliamella apicola]OCG57890.1 hypothetical protein A9G40_11635 [Gilliamella apicola]OCG70859.1 hypothetical protein A9G43_06845 [Gilliamella apicola]
MTNSTNNTVTKQFFDLHTTGIGYLNRIREVKVKNGKPYLSCTIAALRGNCQSAEYTYINCNVTGEKAKNLVEKCIEANKANKKILISFCVGDIYAETFTYSTGVKKGDVGINLKARLLKISSIKIDGELKYSDKIEHLENQSEPQEELSNVA